MSLCAYEFSKYTTRTAQFALCFIMPVCYMMLVMILYDAGNEHHWLSLPSLLCLINASTFTVAEGCALDTSKLAFTSAH